jgi:hypothetical protein
MNRVVQRNDRIPANGDLSGFSFGAWMVQREGEM